MLPIWPINRIYWVMSSSINRLGLIYIATLRISCYLEHLTTNICCQPTESCTVPSAKLINKSWSSFSPVSSMSSPVGSSILPEEKTTETSKSSATIFIVPWSRLQENQFPRNFAKASTRFKWHRKNKTSKTSKLEVS